MVTKSDVKHLGWLSRIDLSEEELDRYASQIEQIIAYLDVLDKIELKEVESIKGKKKFSELRNDEARIFGEDSLQTPNRKDGFVKGPRMV